MYCHWNDTSRENRWEAPFFQNLNYSAIGSTIPDMAKETVRRKHDKPMQIRMNAELYDLIQQASGKSGLTTSGWVRDRLARLARRELRETGDDTPRRKPREPEAAGD